jgi:lipopolysaccharide/colanic/teichoic acid biosynthesis glycosyltransferase
MQKQLRSLHNRIFWNMFIRSGLQMFYPMMLLALKRLNESDKPSKLWSEIIKVVVLSVFLIFTFLFMVEKREEVDDDAFKEKYGAYLTNVETFLKPAAIHYPAVFLSRRLFMAITITFLKFNLVT